MQPAARASVLAEQVTTLGRQANAHRGALFYQHHVLLAVHQVLTDGGDLDVDLRFMSQLLDNLNFTFQRNVGDLTGEKVFGSKRHRQTVLTE